MADIFQTKFWNAFSWMEMFELRLKFHLSLFLRVQLTIPQHWFRYWLGAGQAPSHYLNQCWWVYWRIYASFDLIELICSDMAEFMYRGCFPLNLLVVYIPNFLYKWPQNHSLSTLKPKLYGHHCADNIFKCINSNENFIFWYKFHCWFFPWIQLTIRPSVIFEVMSCHHTGHKPLKWTHDDFTLLLILHHQAIMS